MDLLSYAEQCRDDRPVPAGPADEVPVEHAERTDTEERQARRLEATGRFRILRKLVPRPIRPLSIPQDGSKPRLAVIVDTETTGLDHAKDEVIEIGAVAVTFDDDGIRDVVATFSALQQPSRRLSTDVARLTGLTDAMLKGKSIDRGALAAFVRPAELVIAHNARFDRPFCDRLGDAFADARWGCSATDVDWVALGADGTKLGQLLASVGFFHDGHRAVADCLAVVEILGAERYSKVDGAFRQLVRASAAVMYDVRAEGAPYSERSLLKERGYRWDVGGPNRPKCWYRIVSEAALSSELFFLRHEIYRGQRMPVVTKIEAGDRFRR